MQAQVCQSEHLGMVTPGQVGQGSVHTLSIYLSLVYCVPVCAS